MDSFVTFLDIKPVVRSPAFFQLLYVLQVAAELFLQSSLKHFHTADRVANANVQ